MALGGNGRQAAERRGNGRRVLGERRERPERRIDRRRLQNMWVPRDFRSGRERRSGIDRRTVAERRMIADRRLGR